jgi:thiol-disulfide isomerase/thioredoxin
VNPSPVRSPHRSHRTRSTGTVLAALLAVVALVLVGCGSDDEDPIAAGGEPGVCPVEAGEPLPMLGDDGTDSARGCTIPTAEGVDLAGEEITIGPDGPARLIVFVAHWCPHCQAEVPRIVEHLADTPLPDDVELIGVSTSANPEAPNYPADAWLQEEGWTVPTLDDVDNTVAQQFGLSAFPYFVAVDADGAVVARGSGELTMEQFDTLVEGARTGSL